MILLGKAQGLFDLNNSNCSVGSYISLFDVLEIFGVTEGDIEKLEFTMFGNINAIDERKLRKAWYEGTISNAPAVDNSSLDELILIAIIRKALPNCEIERQIRIKRFKMDLKLTFEGKSIFIEFDGPSHFAASRYGKPEHEPFRKKKIIENETGIEVVNWAYWIQRCEDNVKILFNKKIKGFGVLWSTNIHFGDFCFENSCEIIESINNRFNVNYGKGYGYFYTLNSLNRNNPEHPIIEKIRIGKEKLKKILPKGYADKKEWLPEKLMSL